MSRFTQAERDEIRTLFRQLADIQATQTIERLEANPNSTFRLDIPKGQIGEWVGVINAGLESFNE